MPTPSEATPNAAKALRRELGLFDGIALVVGTIIGSGVFLVPSGIAKQLNSALPVILVWVVGGVLSLLGGLALGEMGAMFPKAGGLYVYLRHAYGRPVGFLYGWGLLTLIHSGSIATLAVAFRLYFGQLFTLNVLQQKAVGVSSVLFLTLVNCFGLRVGKFVQNLFAVAKLGGLAIMIFLLVRHAQGNVLAQNFRLPDSWKVSLVPLGVSLVAVLWAYEGWHVVSFTTGEFKRPQRDLPLSLLYGTVIVAFVYVLANFGYYSVLPLVGIQQSECVAASAVNQAIGSGGKQAISLLILISIFGAANGMVLAGPRVYYAMAKDGLFLTLFGHMNHRYSTPLVGIVIQGVWASLLTLMGTFQQLFTYVIFTSWLFYAIAVIGVVILRFRHPHVNRPFRAPFLPLLVALFVLAGLGMAASTIIADPKHALIGIGLILSGLPVYLLFRNTEARREEVPLPTV